jgi:hypothetical protein
LHCAHDAPRFLHPAPPQRRHPVAPYLAPPRLYARSRQYSNGARPARWLDAAQAGRVYWVAGGDALCALCRCQSRDEPGGGVSVAEKARRGGVLRGMGCDPWRVRFTFEYAAGKGHTRWAGGAHPAWQSAPDTPQGPLYRDGTKSRQFRASCGAVPCRPAFCPRAFCSRRHGHGQPRKGAFGVNRVLAGRASTAGPCGRRPSRKRRSTSRAGSPRSPPRSPPPSATRCRTRHRHSRWWNR